MTRKFVVAAAVALFGLASVPALAQTTITGAWEVTMVTPQGENTVDVNFKQDGQNVTGELVTPMGTAPFKGTLVSDALKVIASIDMQGTALELTFDAKVTGNTLAGTVKFGDFGDAPFTGKRKAGGAAPAAASTAAAAAAAPRPAAASTTAAPAAAGGGVSGNWDLMVDIAGNQMPITAKLQQSGTALTGTLSTPQGDVPIKGTMNGNAMALDFEVPGGMAVSMTGTLGANGTLTGKMSIPGFGDGDWTGKKSN